MTRQQTDCKQRISEIQETSQKTLADATDLVKRAAEQSEDSERRVAEMGHTWEGRLRDQAEEQSLQL